MNTALSAEFSLELLNGNWGIAASALIVICSMYLWHELRARHISPFGARLRFTPGMRVAVATLAMSLGILIRSAETWRWRVTGGGLENLSQLWLNIGGIIGVVGFLCLIRELSTRLYGRGPWLWSLVAMTLFTLASIARRFL